MHFFFSKHKSIFDDMETYEIRCRDEDYAGFRLIFMYDDGIERIVDLSEYLQNLEQMEVPQTSQANVLDSLEDDKKLDPARKFQFDYGSSVSMVDRFPEAAILEKNDDQCLSFAPGEGKFSENILFSQN